MTRAKGAGMRIHTAAIFGLTFQVPEKRRCTFIALVSLPSR